MLRDAAILLLLQRAGQRQSDITLPNQLISEMVMIQETTLEQGAIYPWFLLTEQASSITAPYEERLPVPDDFLIEWSDGGLYIYDATQVPSAANPEGDPWSKLTRNDEVDRLRILRPGAGTPTDYALVGQYFILRPTPNAVFTIKMKYKAKQTSLAGTYGGSGNIENNWLKYASDLMIAETGIIMAEDYIKDAELAATFHTKQTKALVRLLIFDTARMEEGQQRKMGDD